MVIPRLQRELANTYFGGEAFPVLQLVAGRIGIIAAITHPTVRYLYWMGLWSEVPTTDLQPNRPSGFHERFITWMAKARSDT